MPLAEIQAALIYIFKIWGMPRWIKVDNGRPFGDPQALIIPPLALWLIAMGVKVIWNRPRTPQDNAIVERSQEVLARWTEIDKACDAFDLQMRLWKETEFHNFHFPVSRFKGKTRWENFPQMLHSGRKFKAHKFKLKRVLKFLQKADWERLISKNGQVSMLGQRLQVGKQFQQQQISIKLSARNNSWNCFDKKGKLIKVIPKAISKFAIWNLDLSLRQ